MHVEFLGQLVERQPLVLSLVMIAVHDSGLFAEQRFDVATAAQHAQDQDIVAVNAVRNHVVSDHETAYAGSQVFVAATADVRLAGE